MKNTKNNVNVLIRGTVVGKIWMPSQYCTQHFSMDVVRERERLVDRILSISEAVARVTNFAGDFQHCSIADCTLEISYRIGNRIVTKVWDITDAPSIAEYKADEEEMNAYYDIADYEN